MRRLPTERAPTPKEASEAPPGNTGVFTARAMALTL